MVIERSDGGNRRSDGFLWFSSGNVLYVLFAQEFSNFSFLCIYNRGLLHLNIQSEYLGKVLLYKGKLSRPDPLGTESFSGSASIRLYLAAHLKKKEKYQAFVL